VITQFTNAYDADATARERVWNARFVSEDPKPATPASRFTWYVTQRARYAPRTSMYFLRKRRHHTVILSKTLPVPWS